MKRWLPFLALALLLVAFRWAGMAVEGWPVNFQPVAALLFCAIALVPAEQRGKGLIICLGIWAIAYPLWNALAGWDWTAGLVGTLVAIAVVCGIAYAFRRARNVFAILSGVTLSALAFYLVTGVFSFFTLPDYEKTWTGFYYAMWGQAPHLAQPTWVFLRNMVGANLLFTALFYAANIALPEPEEEEVEEDEAEVVEG